MTGNVPQDAARRTKHGVVFVGSFARSASDGTIGGQSFACRTLVNSRLQEYVTWHLIDSTMRTQPPPRLIVRLVDAGRRVFRLVWMLMRKPVDGVLVFSAYMPSSLAEKGLMCIIARLARKRVALSLRSEIKTWSNDWLFRRYARWVVSHCDTVICQSEMAARNLRALLDNPTINAIVIPNWIDVALYRPAVNLPLKVAAHSGTTFLFVGWLETYKGIFDLLAAARQLDRQRIDFQLIICGGGSQRAALEEQCAEFNLAHRVEFRGWVTDQIKLEVFWQSQVLVLPSYSEGLPNVLLEAMAAGLAIITTPVGGIPSVVEAGINGLLVEPGNQSELAQAMVTLAIDEAQVRRMGNLNRARAASQHDIVMAWPRMAKALDVSLAESN